MASCSVLDIDGITFWKAFSAGAEIYALRIEGRVNGNNINATGSNSQ